MVAFIETDDNAELVKSIPEELPILPLRNTVAFPFSALPLVVGIPRSVKLVKDAQEGNRLIGLGILVRDPAPALGRVEWLLLLQGDLRVRGECLRTRGASGHPRRPPGARP